MKSVGPLKLTELAIATSADPVLLGTLKSAIRIRNLGWVTLTLSLVKARILRSLGSIGAVAEIDDHGEEAYAPTKMSKTLATPTLAAGVELW